MRQLINKYGIPIVVVGVLIVGVLFFKSMMPKRNPAGNTALGFFVDEVTGVESIHPVSELPPLIGADGKPTIVRAMKYSCEGGANPKTIYLLKFTPEALAELQSLSQDDPKWPKIFDDGQLVRSPAPDSPWVVRNSPPGEEVTALPDCPNGKPIVMVSPQGK